MIQHLMTHNHSETEKFGIKSIILLNLILFTLLMAAGLETIYADPGVLYVNNATGNDSWNGQSAAYDNVTGSGPKMSIKNATGSITDNGVVNIAGGLYTGEGNTNITFLKNMTLKGENEYATIIDARENTRILIIPSGVMVKLENLTFTQALSDNGGAIQNNGILKIINSSFTNNTANDGGAIYNNGDLTIQNSTFTYNQAIDDSGGAIFNYDGSNMDVTDSTFTGNSATYGGAICNYNYSSLRCLTDMERRMAITHVFNGTYTMANVINCTFTGNTAGYYGGAITTDNYGNITITCSDFTLNTADRYGGAVNNDFYSTAIITGCNFSNNSAPNGSGGALDNYYYANSYLTTCTFFNNTANYGGALCNDDDGPLNVTNCIFTGNSATIDGGAINNDDKSVTTVINSIFTGNTAVNGSGGAIDNYSSSLTVTGSNFQGNLAGNGGAIDNIYGKETINNSNFTGNSATINGGAIYGTDTLNINNSTFTSNCAVNGGAVYNSIGTLTITKSTFHENQVTGAGGAIFSAGSAYNWKGVLSIMDSLLKQNNATDGAAIFNTGTLTVTNTLIIQNQATGNGGAIYTAVLNGNTKSVVITGSIFQENQAVQGSFIYNKANNCEFHFNSIVQNMGTVLYSTSGVVNAQENWWGSNNPDFTSLIEGIVNYSPWIYLTINTTLNIINNTGNSTINTSFNNLYNGVEVTALDPESGHIPDGVTVILNVPWGSLRDLEILHHLEQEVSGGITSVRFYAIEGAINSTYNPVMVTATMDNYTTNSTESAYITISPAADLYVTVTSNMSNPAAGEQVTLTYKLGNNGPDTASNVTVTILVPEGFYLSGITGDGTWFYNETTRMITWNFSSVIKGDPYLYLHGWFTQPGDYSFTAYILSATYNINSKSVIPFSIKGVAPVSSSKNGSAQVNADTTENTVGMQNTGVPILPLALGIISVLVGLAGSRIK